MTNNMMPTMRNAATRMIACMSIFFVVSLLPATAQLFPGPNDTIKVSPWSWWYNSTGFYGYTPMNTTGFNSVMEKNGYGRLANWQFSVGLGQTFWRGDWSVALYGYVGATPQERGSSANVSSSLLSWGLEEYIGYTVLKNEQFRLYPQVGLHVNFHHYNAREIGANVDATTLQAGTQPPQNKWSLNMNSSSVGFSFGVGGDVRFPIGPKYKLETNPESLYQADFLLGFQVAYNLGFGGGNWSMSDGTRVTNLPGISPGGVQARLTFGTDLRLLK